MKAKTPAISATICLATLVAAPAASGMAWSEDERESPHTNSAAVYECIEVGPQTAQIATREMQMRTLLAVPQSLKHVPMPVVVFRPGLHAQRAAVPLHVNVLDPSGAVVAGTHIVLQTGLADIQSGTTDVKGVVLLGECHVGAQVFAEAAGFRPEHKIVTDCANKRMEIVLQISQC